MNYRAVSSLLSRLVALIAAAQVLPLLWSLGYREGNAALGFAASIALSGGAALLLHFIGRGEDTKSGLYRREGILIVVGGWALASLCGALPYLLTGDIGAPVDAIFESASGFTTTGASILTDIEAAGRGVLFWRCLTQWLGGLGIIVLFVALLAELGPGARFLYKLEVPGPTAEVLQAHVRQSAIQLWKLYLALTVAESILLMLAGLDLYDALTHSLSTLSTGGFSPRATSVEAFGSPIVDVIVMLFMVAAGVNFSLFIALSRGRLGVLRDRELTVYLGLLATTTVWITWDLTRSGAYDSVAEALRFASFQVISLMTTTGFATADYDLWSDGTRSLLLGLMVLGGCAGSTAGGLKVARALIAWKAAKREARRIFDPNTIIPIAVGGATVPGWVSSSVAGFVILFFAFLVAGTILLALAGNDLLTAASASLACLSNIGPGISAVGPTKNFAHFGDFEKIVLILLMWLGRLEILAITAVASRSYWRR